MKVRKHKGSNAITIEFRHRGQRFRPVLRGLDPAKAAHRKRAQHIEAAIRSEIALGTFNLADYQNQFNVTPRMRRAFGMGAALTFGQLLEGYLEDIKRSREHSTWLAYSKAANAYLYPRFGPFQVADLTPELFRELVRELGHVKIKSIRNVLTPARGALERAVADGLIATNPVAAVRLEYLTTPNQRARPEKDPFSQEEITAILSAARAWSPRFANLLQFGFYTGLRESELMALEWGDVDGDSVNVRRAHVMRQEKGTKTAAGARTVNLLPLASAALEAQRRYTLWRGERIFCRATRNLPLLDYDHVRTPWIRVLKAAGVRYRPPNQMRHTFISHMLSSGVNRWYVIDQVGHCDDASLKSYAKWIDAWRGDASGREYGT